MPHVVAVHNDGQVHFTGQLPAAEKVLRCDANQAEGRTFAKYLSEESRDKLTALIEELAPRLRRMRTIPLSTVRHIPLRWPL